MWEVPVYRIVKAVEQSGAGSWVLVTSVPEVDSAAKRGAIPPGPYDDPGPTLHPGTKGMWMMTANARGKELLTPLADDKKVRV